MTTIATITVILAEMAFTVTRISVPTTVPTTAALKTAVEVTTIKSLLAFFEKSFYLKKTARATFSQLQNFSNPGTSTAAFFRKWNFMVLTFVQTSTDVSY